MTDNLRDRIAAVLKAARIVSYWREGIDEADGQPYRSLVIRSDEQAAEYAADAVIRALEADYILVPRSHTLAKAAEEWLKSDD